MNVRPPSYQSEPQIQFLYQLVREIRDGHLQLPRFQRPFVWSEDQQLELFRSIRLGTPIGSIMVWRTNVTDVRCYDALGPYALKPYTHPIRTYIIDGHQRLATLFGALHVPAEDESLPEQIAYFDLETDDFIFASRDEEPNPMWLPLRCVLDFSLLLPFQRSFGGRPDEKELVRRVDIIVTAFSTYKLPVLAVATNDLDTITKTFQRINSQGTPMAEVHMIAALTWSETFDLNERIAAWKEEHLDPLGFGDLDDDVVLHACKVALGFDVYDRDVDGVSKALRDKPGALEESLTSLVDAVQFLRDECRILSLQVVPYVAHIVPLAEVLRRMRGGELEGDKGALRKLYWSQAYWGGRISLPKTLGKIQQLIEIKFLKSFGQEPSRMPVRFDFRNGRCRLFALRLADRIPGGHELLARAGARAIVSLYSVDELMWSDSFYGHANRILAAPEEAGAVRKQIHQSLMAVREGSGTDDDHKLLERHWLSYPEHLREIMHPRAHIMIRAEQLKEMEAEFLQTGWQTL